MYIYLQESQNQSIYYDVENQKQKFWAQVKIYGVCWIFQIEVSSNQIDFRFAPLRANEKSELVLSPINFDLFYFLVSLLCDVVHFTVGLRLI